MENQIIVREALNENDTEEFWRQLRQYQQRDIFPFINAEDKEYFSSEVYSNEIKRQHDRHENQCRYIFFTRGDCNIGFALMVIYDNEDGKCFLMEFCVYPKFRGNSTGKQCAATLIEWARQHGAAYFELNYAGSEKRFSFWKSLGFLPNGTDEWGEPLMMLPPDECGSFSVEIMDRSNSDDWQLLHLENSFLSEIGEDILTGEKAERLKKAVQEKSIMFFLAKRGCRAVGMCSISLCYSTFSCGYIGVFDDFFVEPVFRKKGIARLLTSAAQKWCSENRITSLTVCCSPVDEQMYQALGFTLSLGSTFAYLNGN